jgi:mannitol/fructose-specific phosphotransferase system IIA component (Ntr-type)
LDNNIFHAVPLAPNQPNKAEVIQALSASLADHLQLELPVIQEALLARERLGGTVLTAGIATPHATVDRDTPVYVAISCLPQPILTWRDMDDNPIHLLITFVVPENVSPTAPAVIKLKQFFRCLAQGAFVEMLSQSDTETAALALITHKLEEI